MRFFCSLLLLLAASAEDIPIPNGVVRCEGDSTCLVVCDYGSVPTGTYRPSVEEALASQCEAAVALVAGGYNRGPTGYAQEDVFLATAEVYSLQHDGDGGCDGRLPPLPSARKGMVGGWVDGVAVVCGGEDSEGQVYSDCFYYTTQQEVWSYLGEMEESRSDAVGTVLEGCLVVTGGRDGAGEALDSVEVVGLEGCSWSGRIERLESGRYGHCLVEVGGQVITVGGSPGHYGTAQVYAGLDWQEGGWLNVTGPQKVRYGHSCAVVMMEGEEALIVAGNDFSPSDLAEVYFPGNDSWVWTSYMQAERDGIGMMVLGGRPTAIGGYGHDDHQYHDTAESYDAESGNWWLLPAHNMAEGRKDAVVFAVPGTAFCR